MNFWLLFLRLHLLLLAFDIFMNERIGLADLSFHHLIRHGGWLLHILTLALRGWLLLRSYWFEYGRSVFYDLLLFLLDCSSDLDGPIAARY